MSNLVEVRGLQKRFPVRRGPLQAISGEVCAVDGVDLSIVEGECLAIVGESGSGKSTLARCVVALQQASEGEVRFAGEELMSMAASALRRIRRNFQMVFQDPSIALSPRLTVGELVTEPLEVFDLHPSPAGRQARVRELLSLVGVSEALESSYPHELSGGERQRVSIARALACEPRLLVADEPVAALDVSLRGQILNLLTDLQERFGLTLLIVAHDLALVEQISDRVAVMYAGRIVELGTTARLFRAPQHPYTRLLLDAAPRSSPRDGAQILGGEAPDLSARPDGCRFAPRCPIAEDRCAKIQPNLAEVAPGNWTACHYPGEMD